MSRCAWLRLVGAMSAALFVAACGSVERRSSSLQPVAITPVVRLNLTDKSELLFVLENAGTEPIRYLPGGDNESLAMLDYTLMRDGKVVPPVETAGLVPLAPERIRTVQPGESISNRIRVGDRWYGALSPGRYTLFANMEGQPKTNGLTQLRFSRKVAYIDFVLPGKE